MKKKLDVKTSEQSGFMLTINFNGKDWSTSFMSRDIWREAIGFLLWINVANFFKQSSKDKDEYIRVLDRFLVGIENITEEYIGPAFVEDKKDETKKIVKELKKTIDKSSWHKKQITKKVAVNNKK